MGLNPSQSESSREWKDSSSIGLEGAEVTRSPSHTEGDNKSHAVYVKPDTMERELLADVAVGLNGDTQIPTEQSRVVIGYRVNERPLVLGERYKQDDSVPDFEPGERVVGHPLTESYIKLSKNGSVTIEGNGGGMTEFTPTGGITHTGTTGNTVDLTDKGDITVSDDNGNTITIDDNGIRIEGTSGNTVQLDTNGNVTINGGSTKAITDVSSASTNEYGGITSLDITRSSSVYLP